MSSEFARRRKYIAWTWGLMLLLLGLTAAAAHGAESHLPRQAEIYHTLEERKDAGRGRPLGGNLSFSGLLELEGVYGRKKDAEGTSSKLDGTLATVQAGIEVRFSQSTAAELILLYEDGEGGITADEAVFAWERDPWELLCGLQDLPTGTFPSHMITGPLTESLGEASGLSLVISFAVDRFSAHLFAARGEAGMIGEGARINDWGAGVSFAPHPLFNLRTAWFSDIADSDAGLVDEYRRRTAGWSASAVLAAGDFEILGEYLAAAQRFHPGDLDHDLDGTGDRPRAWNVEAAWEVVDVLEVAARLEGSAEFPGEPEMQYGGGISWSPVPYVSLSLEYLRGEFDEPFGDGLRRRDQVTTQAAFEF